MKKRQSTSQVEREIQISEQQIAFEQQTAWRGGLVFDYEKIEKIDQVDQLRSEHTTEVQTDSY